MRFMLDSMIFDLIIADDSVFKKICDLDKAGLIKIVVTHIQQDQISCIPDQNKRQRIAAIPKELIATRGVVLNKSRFGLARFGSPRTHQRLDEISIGNPQHIEDALIAATAEEDVGVLVTEDKTLKSRIERNNLNVQVWSFQQFLQFIQPL